MKLKQDGEPARDKRCTRRPGPIHRLETGQESVPAASVAASVRGRQGLAFAVLGKRQAVELVSRFFRIDLEETCLKRPRQLPQKRE